MSGPGGYRERWLADRDRLPPARRATVRRATVRPATVRPATVRPATVRPATVRPLRALRPRASQASRASREHLVITQAKFPGWPDGADSAVDRKSTRLNSSHVRMSYA